MFEEKTPSTPSNPTGAVPTPPGNLPVEDIFSEVDKAIPTAPPVFKPPVLSQAVPSRPGNLSSASRSRRGLLIVAIVAVVLVVGGGLIFLVLAWRGRPANPSQVNTNKPNVSPTVPNVNQETNIPVANVNLNTVNTNQPTNVNGQVVVPLDTDHDGLTDQEENNLGTDPLRTDTDSDGLTDYEEVNIYQTNPLNPDTDSDGHNDGTEVRQGYNPKGPGKIFNLPQP